MASEQINRILDSEKKAALIEKEARLAADKILEESRIQAASNRDKALKETDKTIASLHNTFQTHNQEYVASVQARAEQAAIDLRNAAMPRFESAVAATLHFITGKESDEWPSFR